MYRNIDMTLMLDRIVDKTACASRLAEIGAVRMDSTANRPRFACGRIERCLMHVGQHKCGALLGELKRDGFANALGCTRHNCNFPDEPSGHVWPEQDEVMRSEGIDKVS